MKQKLGPKRVAWIVKTYADFLAGHDSADTWLYWLIVTDGVVPAQEPRFAERKAMVRLSWADALDVLGTMTDKQMDYHGACVRITPHVGKPTKWLEYCNE